VFIPRKLGHERHHGLPALDRAAARARERTQRQSETIESGELASFEPSEQALDFVAKGDTQFVIGSAVPHPYELHLGNYSVHTSLEALLKGESEIRRIGKTLVEDGTLRG
jgi:hypothetical protein